MKLTVTKRTTFLIAPLLLALFAASWSVPGMHPPQPQLSGDRAAQQRSGEARNRSPVDLVLSHDGRSILTVNSASDTVSLIDLQRGMAVAETKTGHHPFGVALSRNDRTVVITNLNSNSLSVFEAAPGSLRPIADIPVGDAPRGVVLSPDGNLVWIALSGEDCVVCVDLRLRKMIRRVAVGIEPWQVALSSDGKTLAVGNARSQDMSIVDVVSGQVDHTVRNLGHNMRHVAISPDGLWAYAPHIAERLRPATKDSIDRGWIIGNRLSRCPVKEAGPRESLALDTEGDAVADIDGLAISPDGERLALTAGGTHELLLLRLPLPFVAYGGPADLIEPELLNRPDRFRRIKLGGRPMGVAFSADGTSVFTSDYLKDQVLQVNVLSGNVIRTLPLGPAQALTLARQGETVFLDADRSYHHWYSCNSCHVEGDTNGSLFDTFNDGSYDTPKKTLSLRGVSRTGPWTWHGWQKSLRQLAHDSLTHTMQGPEPTAVDLDALMAYLATLEFRHSPYRTATGQLSAPAQRGQAIFTSKGCAHCHAPPDYTTPEVYLVGLESSTDVYRGFNPPSLRGVYHRSPYLHLGQAHTLREVLTQYHRSSQLTGKPDPTPAELDDLIAFLRSL